VVQGVNKSVANHNTSKLLDGNPSTSWRPFINDKRNYPFTIYLGGLYRVEVGQVLLLLGIVHMCLVIIANNVLSHQCKCAKSSVEMC